MEEDQETVEGGGNAPTPKRDGLGVGEGMSQPQEFMLKTPCLLFKSA